MESSSWSSMPKTRFRGGGGGGGFANDSIEVIEIEAEDCVKASGSRRKNKRVKVVPHDVIDIDGDEDPSGVLTVNQKANTGNKGKETLVGFGKNWANHVEEALAQNLMAPASASEVRMNGVPMNALKGFALESPMFGNYNNGSSHNESFHNGYDNLSYQNDNMPYSNGAFGLESQFNASNLPLWVEASNPWFDHPSGIDNNPNGSSSLLFSSQLNSSLYQGGDEVEVQMVNPIERQKKPSAVNSGSQSSSRREREEQEDEVMKTFRLFKVFDTVKDHSDHHYTNPPGLRSKQASNKWAKTIQQEWKILEKDLPDTIFVRVYEERMDLLRAVIVGAAGTPYHDGLFFFDFFFPSDYPKVPPQVYYHSGGVRLNPNLYNNGYVCLSLLNTWQGNKNEKWTPGKSTVLQVLLSIQALVLNAKPYFNEPGYARMAGSKEGERLSQDYNENTYILSCKTMLYTLRKPPKHFEPFVAGHFRKNAHAILVACKAYMEGAQVGCLVGEGVQDVDEGDKSCSQNFKMQVSQIVEMLVPEFKKNGSTDCDQFLSPKNNNSHGAGAGAGGGLTNSHGAGDGGGLTIQPPYFPAIASKPFSIPSLPTEFFGFF